MVGERQVAPSHRFLSRGALLGLLAAFAFAACSDDKGVDPRSTGGGGEASTGATSSAGGSTAASSHAGQAGAPAPGSAGSEAGEGPGTAGHGAGGAPALDGVSFDDFCELMSVRARQWLRDCRNIANAEDWW